MAAVKEKPVIVIDNGSRYIKAGFHMETKPRVVVGCILGKPHGIVGDPVLDTDCNVKSYPVKNGVVQDWDDMSKIWTHIFENELRVDPKDYRVLLSEPMDNPDQNRQKAAEIMLEDFGVKAVCFGNEHVLAVATSKGCDGLSITSGHGVTYVVPVVDMRAVPLASVRLPFSGSKVDEILLGEIKGKSEDFSSSAGIKLLSDIKENHLFVSMDFKNEVTNFQEKTYRLPDGNVIKLGPELISSTEVFFSPALYGMDIVSGIPKATCDAIAKCNVDIRANLYANIVLTGGSTLFPNFVKRLEKELSELGKSNSRIAVYQSDERKDGVYKGGCIYAGTSQFKKMCVTKAQFREFGPSIFLK